MRSLLPRLGRALLGWVLVFGVMALAAHPERCPTPNRASIDIAARAAVDWLGGNIQDDGRYLYRYDRDRSVVESGYSEPRHAGVMWSLYQAENAGIDGAAGFADAGLSWALERIKATPVGPAFGGSDRLETGSTALLVAALDERRQALDDPRFDELMVGLGHTLVATVETSGAVSAVIDRHRGPLPQRSPFYTGEALWALARLHLTFPDEGFDIAASRLLTYLVESRDAEEAPWPPISDHWAAYAFETIDRWPDSPSATGSTENWRNRQLELFGLQVRFESQRNGGLTQFTRGNRALAAGIGTLGEGLGNWLELDRRTGVLGTDREVVRERAICAAGLLVDRQADVDDTAIRGAWFRLGDTQMDDQQHALSALLLVRKVATE